MDAMQYNAIKNTVAQEYRKHQGSLAIKEISTILQV